MSLWAFAQNVCDILKRVGEREKRAGGFLAMLSETLWLARRTCLPRRRGKWGTAGITPVKSGGWRGVIWEMLEGAAIKGLTGNIFPLVSGSRSSKTFKPKKNIPEGSHQYELLKHAEATLGSGNLRQAVMLPEGEDLNEWIAVNSKSYERGIYLSVEAEWENQKSMGFVLKRS